MDTYQHYRTEYEQEHQRKDVFNARLGVPLTALTLVIGGIAYFLNQTPKPLSWWSISFLLPLTIGLGFAINAVRLFIRCMHGYVYQYNAPLMEIADSETEFKKFNADSRVSDSRRVDFSEKLQEHLKRQYAVCTRNNAEINKTRNTLFLRTVYNTFLAGMWVAITAIPFHVHKFFVDQPTDKVKIANASEVVPDSINIRIENAEDLVSETTLVEFAEIPPISAHVVVSETNSNCLEVRRMSDNDKASPEKGKEPEEEPKEPTLPGIESRTEGGVKRKGKILQEGEDKE